MELKEISHEEYLNGLKEEILDYGLLQAIQNRCQEIFETVVFPIHDTEKMYIVEMLNEIEDLVSLVESEKENG